MAPKPTIVIVPGSFSTASMYYDLVTRIEKEGYEVYVNSLQSTIRNPPEKPATLEDDAVFFRGIIEGLADQGKDIMLLCHSYGGVVGTEAAKGVGKVDRQAKGQAGGITRMAYLAAVVPPEGSSLLDEQGEAPPEIVEVSNDGFMTITGVEMCARGTFLGLELEKAMDIVRLMSKHSALSFAGKTTYAAYKHIPTSYIKCENDFIVATAKQQIFIDRMGEASGKKVDVHPLNTGHSPNVTAPDDLVKIIVQIANTV